MTVHSSIIKHGLRLYYRNTIFTCSCLWKDQQRNLHRTSVWQSHPKEPYEQGSHVRDMSLFPLSNIRNFSIIAHVDHGKSTLADRILEITGAIEKDGSNKQVLDKLQVERERGITVKAQTASIVYRYKDQDFLLNLIDTPGHVDFTYEVSRSLAACEGVILLVDANEGVQAQTVANFYLAFASGLTVIPVLNKIDLKSADPEAVKEQLFNLFEIDPEDVLQISAKHGTGVIDVIERVIDAIPPPTSKCNIEKPFRGLLFDSWFDKYKGAVSLLLVVDGTVRKGDHISSAHTSKSYEVKEVGILTPKEASVPQLYTGQVGFITANMRSPKDAQVGDTLHLKGSVVTPLEGFRPAKPMVFAGVYPLDQRENPVLRAALERLTLNDGSVSMKIETSAALGQGWRLGFLGLLHMDVFNQRLEQEHGAQVVITTPSVPYKVELHGEKVIEKYGGREIIVTNPSHWPDPIHIVSTSEPMVMGTIITPDRYLGAIIGLCQEKRGVQHSIKNIDEIRIIMQYQLPLNEIVVDFYDKLKSVSSGYATFDYEDTGFQPSNLVKLDFLLNSKVVEELSVIVHKSKAASFGRHICEKLQEKIPRQLFHIGIQAAVGGKILARTNIKPLRKDVTAKLYGGDITRRQKLLKQQADGKRKMKMYGKIEVPRETFISILKR
ncbi:translation factor Guf1, mitochondrial [Macrobrachium rosenbergii]|uniref:translation factor Guf1, mitochondrial n=1 Tax=Macrobrachium rosenbergii TaxID=79674 RepID=UPI0034D3F935